MKTTLEKGDLLKPNVRHVIFGYNFDGDRIWYNMSGVFGDSFAGRTLTPKSTEQNCNVISWPAGKPGAVSNAANCQA